MTIHSELIKYIFVGVVEMANAWSIAQLPPRVAQLVHEGKAKTCITFPKLLEFGPLLDTEDIPQATAYLSSNKDYTSYFLLYAIKKCHPQVYEKIPKRDKAAIMCSALKNSAFVNDWGLLEVNGQFNREAAKSLLDIGKEAIIELRPLLDDDHLALLAGSQEMTLSVARGYRRKDYAFRYITILMGRTPTFDDDQKTRNMKIEILKRDLQMQNK